jgi:P27 family predicted phage terminase small subunit
LLADKRAADEWQRLAPMLRKVRIVTDADRSALLALCLEWSRYLTATEKVAAEGMMTKAPSGYPIPSPYLSIATRALHGCTRLWSELGLTPSSRTRVAPAQPGAAGVSADGDAFAEFDEPPTRH